MKEELLKELKELNELVEDMIENDEGFENMLKKKIKKAYKEKALISINKKENGDAEVKVEGNGIAILIALAGLEKAILEKLNTSKQLWELIKHTTGVRDND